MKIWPCKPVQKSVQCVSLRNEVVNGQLLFVILADSGSLQVGDEAENAIFAEFVAGRNHVPMLFKGHRYDGNVNSASRDRGCWHVESLKWFVACTKCEKFKHRCCCFHARCWAFSAKVGREIGFQNETADSFFWIFPCCFYQEAFMRSTAVILVMLCS